MDLAAARRLLAFCMPTRSSPACPPCLTPCRPPSPPTTLLHRPADDHPSAKEVLEKWLKKYGLQNKPKYVFGISSGASFAVKFPKTMTVQGVISGETMERLWLVDDWAAGWRTEWTGNLRCG